MAQAAEIKEYLTVLDLIVDCSIGETMKTEEGIVYRNAEGVLQQLPDFSLRMDMTEAQNIMKASSTDIGLLL